MSSLSKKFLKPPLTGLLKEIPSEDLDRSFTDIELHKIASVMLQWKDKAVCLGLSDSEIEDIESDNHRKSNLQKFALMKKWREKYGPEATLRELLRVSSQHGWTKFACTVCKELGHIKEGKKNCSY